MILTEEFLNDLPSGQSVAVIVGENGAGKSRLLKEIAHRERARRPVYAIANTVYDRFTGVRGIRRLSASSGRYLPQRLLKQAITAAAGDSLVRLRTLADTLFYCGYRPGVGMYIQFKGKIDERLYNGDPVDQILSDFVTLVEHDKLFRRQRDLTISELVEFLPLVLNPEYRGDSTFWLSFDGDLLKTSQSGQASRLLAWEPILRSAGVLERIDLKLLPQQEPAFEIWMTDASSGQLTLIACLVFLAVSVLPGSTVLIDEPENSLHPLWQREYVERLLDLLAFRETTVVIATHAPIIVSGAQLIEDASVKVYRLSAGTLTPVKRQLRPGEKTSLEETVFQSFGTVTPANHFVSETLTREFARLRAGTITADDMAVIVNRMKQGSFDEQQRSFLNGIVDLARAVEAELKNFGDTSA